MTRSMRDDLERVFNPRTIAVVGSREGMGWVWPSKLAALARFKGKLYAVRPNPDELAAVPGLRMEVCQSISDIPEPVDQVLCGAPPKMAPEIVKDAIRKGVGGVVFMTPGFAETNTDDGIRLQKEIVDMARQARLALIGPNCWGIYNPRIGLLQGAGQPHGQSGSVGFVSQSGEHGTTFINEGSQSGITISKEIGYGNAVVVDAADYLEYLGGDEETKIIGMYIEGVRDGRRFFDILKQVARKKPVIIWKVGQTAAAARATASHTGALAASGVVWKAAMRQSGAIEVDSLEEAIDTVRMLLYVKPSGGRRAAVITASGGHMVAITEDFARAGLEVPPLTPASCPRASALITVGGPNQCNPFDMSSNFVMGDDPLSDVSNMLDTVDRDRNIDCIALQFSSGVLRLRQDPKIADATLEAVSDFNKRATKSFLVVLQPGSPEISNGLKSRGVPVFTSHGAARALSRVVSYYRFRRRG